MAALDGAGRPSVGSPARARRHRCARDAFQRGDGVGADALVRLRMQRAQAQIAGVHHERAFAAAAFHRHHLGAAGDHQIFMPDMIEAAAMLTLVMPEPQKRSSVTPLARMS